MYLIILALLGYKDWFIQTYNSPGYTIEAGLGENPLPISQFDKIYKDNIWLSILGDKRNHSIGRGFRKKSY